MRHSYPKKKKKSFIVYLKFKFSYTAYIWQPELGSKADLGLPLSSHWPRDDGSVGIWLLQDGFPGSHASWSGQRRAAGREKPVFLDSFPAAAAFPPGSQLLLPMDPELPRHMSWFLQPRSVCPRIAIIKAIHHTLVGLGFCHSAYYFWDSSMLCLSGVHSFSTPSFIEIQLTYNIV